MRQFNPYTSPQPDPDDDEDALRDFINTLNRALDENRGRSQRQQRRHRALDRRRTKAIKALRAGEEEMAAAVPEAAEA